MSNFSFSLSLSHIYSSICLFILYNHWLNETFCSPLNYSRFFNAILQKVNLEKKEKNNHKRKRNEIRNEIKKLK